MKNNRCLAWCAPIKPDLLPRCWNKGAETQTKSDALIFYIMSNLTNKEPTFLSSPYLYKDGVVDLVSCPSAHLGLISHRHLTSFCKPHTNTLGKPSALFFPQVNVINSAVCSVDWPSSSQRGCLLGPPLLTFSLLSLSFSPPIWFSLNTDKHTLLFLLQFCFLRRI